MVLLISTLFAVLAAAAPQAGRSEKLESRHVLPNGREFIVKRQAAQATPLANRVIPILVGGSSLTFQPNNVAANPGDILQFQFAARNHTVTQSAENTPCQPMQAQVPGAVHSGFIPFDNTTGIVGTFNMPVTSTQPMFLYCAQATHCQEGMVMSVNVVSTAQLITYASLATTATSNTPAALVAGGLPANIPAAQAIFAATQAAPAAAPPAAAAPAAPPAAVPPAAAPPASVAPAVAPPASAAPVAAPAVSAAAEAVPEASVAPEAASAATE